MTGWRLPSLATLVLAGLGELCRLKDIVPDWFYRTVAQPVLFALPDATARALALGTLGALGSSRAGRALIDFMGHMHADPRLATRVGGTLFASPVGLGWRVDPECRATKALQRFGVGCIERRGSGYRPITRGVKRQLCEGPPTSEVRTMAVGNDGVFLVRRETADGGEVVVLPSGEIYPVVAWDDDTPGPGGGLMGGVVLQVGIRDARGGWCVPADLPAGLIQQVQVWRGRVRAQGGVIVAGGVAGPADAVALIEAGASLVLVDAGLIFSGPGLVKRCNAALLNRLRPAGQSEPEETVMSRSWFWATALGAALAAGGALALGLSFGRVLLPYDEQFLGFTAEVLRQTSPKLHAFMAHDRGTLAGVMLGLGWLYVVLARRGILHSVAGAKTAVVASALAGFASFFSFLGFGYFDTLHAFVAAVLFQLTVQVMVGKDGGCAPVVVPIDREDTAWRRSQWGQLCWVVHAVGLVLAGCVILAIGMTKVFVAEDLEFLCMDAAGVQALGDRVVSVVAHDRATLGGMLWASGVGMLLPVLWCHQKGASWLWWAVAGLGLPAYACALGIHVWVGYTDWRHLVPAFAGIALWLSGLVLSRDYLLRR